MPDADPKALTSDDPIQARIEEHRKRLQERVTSSPLLSSKPWLRARVARRFLQIEDDLRAGPSAEPAAAPPPPTEPDVATGPMEPVQRQRVNDEIDSARGARAASEADAERRRRDIDARFADVDLEADAAEEEAKSDTGPAGLTGKVERALWEKYRTAWEATPERQRYRLDPQKFAAQIVDDLTAKGKPPSPGDKRQIKRFIDTERPKFESVRSKIAPEDGAQAEVVDLQEAARRERDPEKRGQMRAAAGEIDDQRVKEKQWDALPGWMAGSARLVGASKSFLDSYLPWLGEASVYAGEAGSGKRGSTAEVLDIYRSAKPVESALVEGGAAVVGFARSPLFRAGTDGIRALAAGGSRVAKFLGATRVGKAAAMGGLMAMNGLADQAVRETLGDGSRLQTPEEATRVAADRFAANFADSGPEAVDGARAAFLQNHGKSVARRVTTRAVADFFSGAIVGGVTGPMKQRLQSAILTMPAMADAATRSLAMRMALDVTGNAAEGAVQALLPSGAGADGINRGAILEALSGDPARRAQALDALLINVVTNIVGGAAGGAAIDPEVKARVAEGGRLSPGVEEWLAKNNIPVSERARYVERARELVLAAAQRPGPESETIRQMAERLSAEGERAVVGLRQVEAEVAAVAEQEARAIEAAAKTAKPNESGEVLPQKMGPDEEPPEEAVRRKALSERQEAAELLLRVMGYDRQFQEPDDPETPDQALRASSDYGDFSDSVRMAPPREVIQAVDLMRETGRKIPDVLAARYEEASLDVAREEGAMSRQREVLSRAADPRADFTPEPGPSEPWDVKGLEDAVEVDNRPADLGEGPLVAGPVFPGADGEPMVTVRAKDGSEADVPAGDVREAASPAPRGDRIPAIREWVASQQKARGDERPEPGRPVVDPRRGRKVADAYEGLKDDNLADPKVKAAYDAMAKETVGQFRALVADHGVDVRFYGEDTSKDDGYPSSGAMRSDLNRGALRVFRGGTSKHPALDAVVPDADLPEAYRGKGLTFNDIFRATHDAFGHYADNEFGPVGEEQARQLHLRLYSPEAARAVSTETLGQNSWVNFGRDEKGALRNNSSKQKDGTFTYAKQKADLLPDDVVAGYEAPPDADAAEAFAAHKAEWNATEAPAADIQPREEVGAEVVQRTFDYTKKPRTDHVGGWVDTYHMARDRGLSVRDALAEAEGAFPTNADFDAKVKSWGRPTEIAPEVIDALDASAAEAHRRISMEGKWLVVNLIETRRSMGLSSEQNRSVNKGQTAFDEASKRGAGWDESIKAGRDAAFGPGRVEAMYDRIDAAIAARGVEAAPAKDVSYLGRKVPKAQADVERQAIRAMAKVPGMAKDPVAIAVAVDLMELQMKALAAARGEDLGKAYGRLDVEFKAEAELRALLGEKDAAVLDGERPPNTETLLELVGRYRERFIAGGGQRRKVGESELTGKDIYANGPAIDALTGKALVEPDGTPSRDYGKATVYRVSDMAADYDAGAALGDWYVHGREATKQNVPPHEWGIFARFNGIASNGQTPDKQAVVAKGLLLRWRGAQRAAGGDAKATKRIFLRMVDDYFLLLKSKEKTQSAEEVGATNEDYSAGGTRLTTMRAQLEKLIEDGDIKSPKIGPYSRALDPTNDGDGGDNIVLDSHMIRYVGRSASRGLGKKARKAYEDAIRKVAESRGVTPEAVQAGLWRTIRWRVVQSEKGIAALRYLNDNGVAVVRAQRAMVRGDMDGARAALEVAIARRPESIQSDLRARLETAVDAYSKLKQTVPDTFEPDSIRGMLASGEKAGWEDLRDPMNALSPETGRGEEADDVPFSESNDAIQGMFRNFAKEGRALVALTEHADATTLSHELAHYASRYMPGSMKQRLRSIMGLRPGDAWTSQDEEVWAREVESYLVRGEAPTKAMKPVLEQAAQFSKEILDKVAPYISENRRAEFAAGDFGSFLADMFKKGEEAHGPNAMDPMEQDAEIDMEVVDAERDSREVPKARGDIRQDVLNEIEGKVTERATDEDGFQEPTEADIAAIDAEGESPAMSTRLKPGDVVEKSDGSTETYRGGEDVEGRVLVDDARDEFRAALESGDAGRLAAARKAFVEARTKQIEKGIESGDWGAAGVPLDVTGKEFSDALSDKEAPGGLWRVQKARRQDLTDYPEIVASENGMLEVVRDGDNVRLIPVGRDTPLDPTVFKKANAGIFPIGGAAVDALAKIEAGIDRVAARIVGAVTDPALSMTRWVLFGSKGGTGLRAWFRKNLTELDWDPEVAAIQNRAQGRREQFIVEHMAPLVDALKRVPKAEFENFARALDAGTDLAKYEDATKAVRKAFDDLGQQMVDVGLMSQETYDAHKGKYFPYLRWSEQTTKAIEKRIGTLLKKQRAGRLSSVQRTELADLRARHDKMTTLTPTPDGLVQRTGEARRAISAVDVVEGAGRARYRSSRSIDDAKAKGLDLSNPTRDVLEAMSSEIHAVEMLRMFKEIREHGLTTGDVLAPGTLPQGVSKDAYVTISNDALGVNGLKTFGDLAGHHVSRGLWSHLETYVHRPSEFERVYDAIHTAVRKGKTAYRIGGHVVQWMGNPLIWMVHGVPGMKIAQVYNDGLRLSAGRSIGKSVDVDGKLVPVTAEFLRREGVLVNDAPTKITNAHLGAGGRYKIDGPASAVEATLDVASKMIPFKESLEDAYGRADSASRAGLYVYFRETGMAHKDAVARVRGIYDMSNVPDGVKRIARGWSFFRFQYSMMRNLPTILKHTPWAMAKVAGVFALMRAAHSAVTGRSEEDYNATLEASAPGENMGQMLKRAFSMPWFNRDGEPGFVSLWSALPQQTLLQGFQPTPAEERAGTPGSRFLGAMVGGQSAVFKPLIEVFTDTDLYSGAPGLKKKYGVDAEDGELEAWKFNARYILQQWSPSILSDTMGIAEAAGIPNPIAPNARPDSEGRLPDVPDAISTFFGMKPRRPQPTLAKSVKARESLEADPLAVSDQGKFRLRSGVDEDTDEADSTKEKIQYHAGTIQIANGNRVLGLLRAGRVDDAKKSLRTKASLTRMLNAMRADESGEYEENADALEAEVERLGILED